MKAKHIASVLSLLIITMPLMAATAVSTDQERALPSMNEIKNSAPSLEQFKKAVTGLLTGAGGLGITTSLNISLADWIRKKFGRKITDRYHVNYAPAIIVATIIEAAALFGWEEVREYFAPNSDIAFWTHYCSAGFASLLNLNKNWRVLTILAALKKSIGKKWEKTFDNPDTDSDFEAEDEGDINLDDEEEDDDTPKPPLVQEGFGE